MSLLERTIAAETCRVQECSRRRAPDALVCNEDLTELWMNRLDRNPDGTYRRRRTFRPADLTGQLRGAAL